MEIIQSGGEKKHLKLTGLSKKRNVISLMFLFRFVFCSGSLPYDICILVMQTLRIRSRPWVRYNYIPNSKSKMFPLIFQIVKEFSHSKFHMADVPMPIPNSEDYFVQAKATCDIKLHAGLLHKIQLLQPTLLTFHYITFKYHILSW